ncbi:MAG: hypothetical protein Q9207_001690 [Kuettlingeria erythrocarpa]
MTSIIGSNVMIEDIRHNDIGPSILDQIHDGLHPQLGGEKKLPTLLLYDERGLQLFEEISYLDEYYLTNAEIGLLREHAISLATMIPEECIILELGSGNLRKVRILLDALELAGKTVDYYALDLSESELHRTLSAVPKHYQHVRCRGLLGTYDDGLDWLKRPKNAHRRKWILSLGSSIGNFGRQEAASFLQGFADTLQEDDALLVGLDACQDKDKVYHAYNDHVGKTHEFVLNGLLHANRLLGKDVFKLKDWKVIGEYDRTTGRHQAFYSPLKDLVIDGAYIGAAEKVRIEESYKYSPTQRNELWSRAGAVPQACFGNSSDDYRKQLAPLLLQYYECSSMFALPCPTTCAAWARILFRYLYVLAKSTPALPLNPIKYAAQAVPSLDEFRQLWSAWDLVTRHMVAEEDLLSRPIDLRNCCLFYLGHIPTFLDIHLTRATGHEPTEPRHYETIFERGIDPDVDDPEQCHAHSEIPDSWPPVSEILTYQDKVRSRVEALLAQEQGVLTKKVQRALWLGFEHEAMHLETLLYMLLQSDRTRPPPGPTPDFQALAQDGREKTLPNEWMKVPATTLTVGMDDPENDIGPERYFGWDNEKPTRQVHVAAIEAKARPLTNEDYARYLIETGQEQLPASWAVTDERRHDANSTEARHVKNAQSSLTNGSQKDVEKSFLKGKLVKTVYGAIALEYALAWPVMASYNELAGCAKWMGGRIPTADEVRSIYSYVDLTKSKAAEKVQAKKISAVNGHLSNDGVEETPPSALALKGSSGIERKPDPKGLFADLEGCNVGFSNFHPTPVTQLGNQLCGRGEMGGAWEWTSSTLEEHGGFRAMDSYRGYTG